MTDASGATPILTPEKLHEIDLILEDIYSESIKAGESLAAVKLKTTQIRGLENIVTSTSRFSEIMNFIKNQAGKERDKQWGKVAPDLLKQLEALEKKANDISEGNADLCLETKIRLARGWGKQVVTHFLYTAKDSEGKE